MATGDDIVLLPGGYVDESGVVHVDVELGGLTGIEEELLADAPAQACTARLTTHLLCQCVRRIGSFRQVTPALVGDLLVGDRDYLLIKLREKTFGPSLWVTLCCPHPECGKAMELELMLDQLPIERRPVSTRAFSLGNTVKFRLPTGGDQEWTAALGITDPVEIRNRMLARCLCGDGGVAGLDESTCQAIETHMQELAPDVDIELDAVCPECKAAFAAPLDLPFVVLRELRVSRRHLEREVHLLAWHYHWSEGDILVLPRQKRQRYVRMVQEELEAMASV